MRASHDALPGRKPFVVGLIVNSTREAIDRVRALRGLNIAALQITPVHYLFKPSAENTVAHFRTIYQESGIPILIYNVIPRNHLNVELMLRVMREVPGVVGMKHARGRLFIRNRVDESPVFEAANRTQRATNHIPIMDILRTGQKPVLIAMGMRTVRCC